MSKLEYNFDPIESALTAILQMTKREEIEPTLQMLSTIQFDRGRRQEMEDAEERAIIERVADRVAQEAKSETD